MTGLIFALVFDAKVPKPKKYDWEREDYNEADDPFLKHFDADGNFIEAPKPSKEELEENKVVEIRYVYKSSSKTKDNEDT